VDNRPTPIVTIKEMHETLVKLFFDDPFVKVLTGFFFAITTTFTGLENYNGVIAVLILYVIDTITGVMASRHEGYKANYFRAVEKGTVYFMALSAGYFADQTIPFTLIQVTLIGFIGMTEFVSILENISRLGVPVPKKLLKHIREKTDSL
jgi:phage-related holin